MNKIELGDKVKCIHSGFVGIVISRSEFINGCIQCEIIPKVGRDNKLIESVIIDEKSLKVITPAKKPKYKTEITGNTTNGGPMRKATKFRGY